MLPGPADDGLEPLRIGATDCVMHDNDAPASFQKLIQVGTILGADRSVFGGITDQDIGVLELVGIGKSKFAIDLHAAVGEQLFPIFQKPRMIMLAGPVSFGSRANKNAQ